jgi:hypothetical protein
MDVEDWLAGFIRGDDADPGDLVGAVNRQEHRFRGHLAGAAGADDYLAAADAADKDYTAGTYTFLSSEFFDTVGEDIAILDFEDKDAAGPALGGFHGQLLMMYVFIVWM